MSESACGANRQRAAKPDAMQRAISAHAIGSADPGLMRAVSCVDCPGVRALAETGAARRPQEFDPSELAVRMRAAKARPRAADLMPSRRFTEMRLRDR